MEILSLIQVEDDSLGNPTFREKIEGSKHIILDPGIPCPICKEEMSVTKLEINKNIGTAYKYGSSIPIHFPMHDEISLELKCHKCGTTSFGIAKSSELRKDPNSSKDIDIIVKDACLTRTEIKITSNPKEFNPSRRSW